jgi:hypothetical protein
MNFSQRLVALAVGTSACLVLALTVKAQVSPDALLDKLVAKGILNSQEAAEIKREAETNNASVSNGVELPKFKISKAIKNVEVYGDLRMRYEYRAAQLGPEAGSIYDAENRWRYSLRLGVRGDLSDDFYYGLRLETSPNERSSFNTFGNSSSSSYPGPFSKANNFSIFLGQAYIGWRPTPWLDISIGRVPQPLYTTTMVWDSDYCPEGIVEKIRYSYGPVDYFATLGQYIYQDVSPGTDFAVQNGNNAGFYLGDFSDHNAYLLAWQLGAIYHVNSNIWAKVAPVVYTYVGHGNATVGFYGPFVGQGVNGYTYNPFVGVSDSGVPGQITPSGSANSSYNQTGINNLAIVELPMELNFKLGALDAKIFGDWSINLEGDDRARAAYGAGEAAAVVQGFPNPFPGGVQLNQSQAFQAGMAVGNNLGLTYGASAKKGTWEARVFWQHVEQYALDPNLLDSDFFEGRGNLQGIAMAFAYSFTDAIIGTLRYGLAERINDQLGTGGFNGDLPLPNPINRFQMVQMDLTLKF